MTEISIGEKENELIKGLMGNMWLFFCYTIQLITIKLCTKFQNPNPSNCGEIFDGKIFSPSYTVTIQAPIHHDSSRFETDGKIGVHRDASWWKKRNSSINTMSHDAPTVSARFIYGSTTTHDSSATIRHGGATNAHDASTIRCGASTFFHVFYSYIYI